MPESVQKCTVEEAQTYAHKNPGAACLYLSEREIEAKACSSTVWCHSNMSSMKSSRGCVVCFKTSPSMSLHCLNFGRCARLCGLSY